MNKKKFLLTLGLTGLLITPCVTLTPHLVKAATNQTEVAEEELEVDYSLPDGVTVENAVEKAQEGDVVNLTLSYDETSLLVHDVLVNGEKACKVDLKHFYFIMPNEKVTVTVNSEVVSTHKVINQNSEQGIVLVGLPSENVVAGTEVTFHVSMDSESAYSFTGEIAATYVENTLTKNLDLEEAYNAEAGVNEYTFIMPSEDVTIVAETELRLFRITEGKAKLDENSPEEDLITSIELIEGSDVSEDGTTIYQTKDITTRASAYLNDRLLVKMRDSDAYIVTGLKIVETGQVVPLEESDEKMAIVSMIGNDVTLEPVVQANYVEFSLQSTASLTPEAYMKNADGEYIKMETKEAIPGTTIYLKATSSNENVRCGGFLGTYTYVSYSGSTSTSTISGYNFTLNEDGYYEYEMDNYLDIVLTPVEVNKIIPTINNSEHVTLTLMDKQEDGTYVETNGFFPGATAYIEAEVLDENYGVKEVVLTYDEQGTWSTSEKEVSATLNEDGYYQVTIPDDDDCSNFRLGVIENQPHLLQGYPFVGEYYVKNVYSSNNGFDVDAGTANTYIHEDGEIMISSSTYQFVSTENTKEDTTGTINFDTEYILAYGPNVIFTSYYKDKLTNNDNYFALKMSNLDATYTYSFMSISSKYQLFEGYETINGETNVICLAYVECGEGGTLALENVELKNVEGNAITLTEFSNSHENVEVFVNGEKVGTLSYGTSYTFTKAS